MPVFMYQFAYTPESWAAQLKTPSNRVDKIGQALCKAAKGKWLGGWYCFGEYDAVLIMELPDNQSMAGIALAVAAQGALKASKTTVLLPGVTAVEGMKMAAEIEKGYKPAR